MFGGKNMPLPFPRHPGWNEFQGKHVCVQVEHAFTQLERLSPQKPPLQNAKHWSGRASRGLVLGRQETQQGCSVLRWFLEAPSVPWAGILAGAALMAPQCDIPLGPFPSSSVRWFSGDSMTQGTKQTTVRAGSGPTLSGGW